MTHHVFVDETKHCGYLMAAAAVLLTRKAGSRSGMTYEVLRAHEEGLLAIADVAAWCWAKGGDWKRRIQPIVCDLRKLP